MNISVFCSLFYSDSNLQGNRLWILAQAKINKVNRY